MVCSRSDTVFHLVVPFPAVPSLKLQDRVSGLQQAPGTRDCHLLLFSLPPPTEARWTKEIPTWVSDHWPSVSHWPGRGSSCSFTESTDVLLMGHSRFPKALPAGEPHRHRRDEGRRGGNADTPVPVVIQPVPPSRCIFTYRM